MRYCNIFKKEGEDYDRYWMSISTEKLDKKGKGTGEYVRSSIGVRLSDECKKAFDENCIKTKSKDVKQGCFDVTDCFFKAVEGKDEPYTVLFIFGMKPEDD